MVVKHDFPRVCTNELIFSLNLNNIQFKLWNNANSKGKDTIL